MRALEVVLSIPKQDVDFTKTMFVSLGDDKFPGCLPLPLLLNALFRDCNDHDILSPLSYPFMTGRPRKARRTMAKVQQKKEDSINSTESKKHPRHSTMKHKPSTEGDDDHANQADNSKKSGTGKSSDKAEDDMVLMDMGDREESEPAKPAKLLNQETSTVKVPIPRLGR